MKFLLAFLFGLSAAFWYRLAHKSAFHGSWKEIKSSLIIFDFDGTICPSYPLFIEQVNLLVRKVGDKEAEDFRNMSAKEIMRNLKVSFLRLPFLLKKARKNVQNQIVDLHPVSDIVEVLQEMKRRGYSLAVLTSNSLENVLPFFRKHQIDLFDFVYTANNVFGKKKHLKAILRKSGLSNGQVYYIGDEIRDIEAAKNAGIGSCGVTWGYNCADLIRDAKPDFFVDKPSLLLSFFYGFQKG